MTTMSSATFDFHRAALKAPSSVGKRRRRRRTFACQEEVESGEADAPEMSTRSIQRRTKKQGRPSRIEAFLDVLKGGTLPFALEWTLAWLIIAGLAVMYAADYVKLVIRSKMSKLLLTLCQNGKGTRSMWLSERISITTVPRTSKGVHQANIDPGKQLSYRLNRLSLVLDQALVEQEASTVKWIRRPGSPTSVRDSFSQTNLRQRMHRQQRSRFSKRDSTDCPGVAIPMATDLASYSNEQIVLALRSSGVARYLASLIMNMANSQRNVVRMIRDDNHRQLLRTLKRVWADVLPFPSIHLGSARAEDEDEERSQDLSILSVNSSSSMYTQCYQKEYLYTISLIVPIYRESLASVRKTLDHALKRCCDPEHVQVVLVNVGDECAGLAEWCDRANQKASRLRAEDVTPPPIVTRSTSNVSVASSFSSGDSTWSTPVRVPSRANGKAVSDGNGYSFRMQEDDEESRQLESMVKALEYEPSDTSVATEIDYRPFEEDEEQILLMEPVVTPKIATKRKEKSWSRIKHVVFHNALGGRGASLNYGAMMARGRLFCFLHADTLLPADWDVHVESALIPPQKDAAYTDLSSPPERWRDRLCPSQWWKKRKRRRQESQQSDITPTMCAFSFDIDTSRQGLDAKPCPPGLRGVIWLGYLRCHICKMPYGDSALTMPASYFHHIGGFPDQPLMEDYELVSLLRRRTQVLPSESMVILPVSAKCSPRRWQKYGVAYTILVNALCVWRYEHGWSADSLFRFYYNK